MDDLSSLLLSAIEETEQWAVAAQEELSSPDLTPRIHGEYVAWVVHAGRNNPSSVLRRCAADKALVEKAQRAINRRTSGGHPLVRARHVHEVTVWHIVLTHLAEGYGLTDHQEGEE